MSAYPPPPPPQSPYDRAALKAQMRAQQQTYKAQRRMARDAYRLQQRALRRRSIVGPLILLAIGVFFLLTEFHRLSAIYALAWFGRWWPAVLIAAGLVLLAEWALDQRRDPALPVRRGVGGGVITLLILLVLVGLSSQAWITGLAWKDAHSSGFGKIDGLDKLNEVLGNRSDEYDAASSAIAPGGLLVIRSPHGDVTVTGSSTDGQVHVDIHRQAHGWDDTELRRRMQQLQPTFSSEGKDLVLTLAPVYSGQADLTVTVPADSAVTVNADRGDVTVSQLKAAVAVSANHGDVTLNDLESNVQLTLNDDDATVTVHGVKGMLSLEGHTGDVDITGVNGALALHGEFFGNTHLQKIASSLRFDSSRTHLEAARLDEELSLDRDSLDAGGLLGPIELKTRDKNITLDRVQGTVNVTDSNGEVHVTSASPLANVTVNNRHGSVDVGVPPASSFSLDAQTKNGDMENDFGLSAAENGDTRTLHGTVGGGSVKISIQTTEGDVTVRKSTIAPLPPSAPPAPPAAPIGIRPPHPPKVPEAPKPPASYSF